jgi:citrate lyase alpha subunit
MHKILPCAAVAALFLTQALLSEAAIKTGRYSLIEAGDSQWRITQSAPLISYRFTEKVTLGEAVDFILSDTGITLEANNTDAFTALRAEPLPAELTVMVDLPLDAVLDLLLDQYGKIQFASNSVNLMLP